MSAVPETASRPLSAWRRVKLAEVCSKPQYGWTTKAARAGSGLKLLRTTDITSGQIDWTTVPFCTELPPDVDRYLVREGDILISRAGSVGVSHLVRSAQSAVFASYLIRFRPGPELLPKYLGYFLQSPGYWKQIAESTAGIAVPNVNASKLQDLELPLAPLDEQERIVAEIEKQFSRLDEAVANLRRVKANLKRHKAALLDAAVKGRIGTESAAGDDELPPGWHWGSVGGLATVGTGATPARSNEAFYRGGTIPWITSSAVNEPFVNAADQFVTDEALRQTNLTLYPPGTLLVAMYGEGKTRGKCSELRIAATTNQALAALQVDCAVRPWLKLFLERNYDHTRGIASGGVQPNLNLGLIRAIRLPLPPADEQHRIVAEVDRRLSIVREVEAEVDANLKRAEALRQAVLTKAFALSTSIEPVATEGTSDA